MHAHGGSSLNTGTGFLQRLFRKGPAHPLIEALGERFKGFDQNLPLPDYDFVVLDTELTGFSTRKDDVVSVGAVRIKGLSITAERFYSLVAPRGNTPTPSTLIHRITPEDLVNAPSMAEVLPDLVEFINGSLIVGHNIGMDMSFLNREARSLLGGIIPVPCVDTMRLAMIYQEELWENDVDRHDMEISYALADLTKKYGLPDFPVHNALNDAVQTAYLFLFLVKKLREGGLSTLKDLYNAGRSGRWYF
jgi:DNA polymerase-3 subunit epsilon